MKGRFQALLLAASTVLASSTPLSAADEIAEFMFWDTMGRAAGQAVSSLNEYRKERQKWQANIAAAKAELERCGGCASARAKLKKWQKVEADFNRVAAGMAQAVGMPKSIRKWLDIPTALTTPPPKEASLRQLDEAWLSKKPDYCQAAIRQHMQCLATWQATRQKRGRRTISYGMAKVPGGPCFQSSRFYKACASDDYDAYWREVAILEARSNGHIVPQKVGDDVIYYSDVPDDFVPNLPPLETVRKVMREPGVHSYAFLMAKATPGRLVEFRLLRFFDNDLQPADKCYTNRKRSEIEKRECDDLYERRVLHHDPVLYCFYNQGDWTKAFDHYEFKYWYGERPAHAALAPLLKRSHKHPLAELGDPRTRCPETLEAARAANKAYARKLASLREEIPQVSTGITLDPSKALIEHRRKTRARVEAEREAKRAAEWKSFPLVGYYKFGTQRKSGPKPVRPAADCTIAEAAGAGYEISCSHGRGKRKGSFTGTASLENEGLLVEWEDGDRIVYNPDNLPRAHRLKGRPSGEGDKSTFVENLRRVARYSREQLIPMMDALKFEGRYRLELVARGETASLDCMVRRNDGYHPNRFKAACIGPDGSKYVVEGHPQPDDPVTLRYSSWYPRRPKVGGKRIGVLRFDVDPALEVGGSVATLEGVGKRGTSARFMQIENGGTPPEAVPEIGKGGARQLHKSGILTLEQFVAMSRGEADKLGMGWAWRHDLARKYLAENKRAGASRSR